MPAKTPKQALIRGLRAQQAIKRLLMKQQANVAKRITVIRRLIATEDAINRDLEVRNELYKDEIAKIEAAPFPS